MNRLATKRQERSAAAEIEELIVSLIHAALERSALELAASKVAQLAHLFGGMESK